MFVKTKKVAFEVYLELDASKNMSGSVASRLIKFNEKISLSFSKKIKLTGFKKKI